MGVGSAVRRETFRAALGPEKVLSRLNAGPADAGIGAATFTIASPGYACAAVGLTEVASATKGWSHVTAVRVPLNEACWNAESYVSATYGLDVGRAGQLPERPHHRLRRRPDSVLSRLHGDPAGPAVAQRW